MSYHHQIRVEFGHCDPARIVFFPRYVEMTHRVLENFFRDEIDRPYDVMMAEGIGTPTARLEVNYRAPSRLGELLDWQIDVLRIGRSSIDFRLEARGQGEAAARVEVSITLVLVDDALKSTPWPDAMRAALGRHLLPEG